MRVSVVGQERELSSIWYPGNEGVRESLGSLIFACRDRS